MVKHWNKLPQEVVNVPSWEVFKDLLDGAWSNLVYLKLLVSTAGRLELDDPQGPLLTQTNLWLPFQFLICAFCVVCKTTWVFTWKYALPCFLEPRALCQISLHRDFTDKISCYYYSRKNDSLGAFSLHLAVSKRQLESVDSNSVWSGFTADKNQVIMNMFANE